MAGDWDTLPLCEAGVTLIDCDHRTPPATEDGFPYVAIPQLKDGRIDLNGVRRISADDFTEWTRKANPQAHDVVLSRRCNPGETAFVPAGLRFALGQNLVLLRSDGTRVYPPFLRWLVRGPKWWEQVNTFINVGAVFESLKCRDIPRFPLPLPPLPEQKRIAHILGALDDKIELNRRMNATLEGISRAIFKSWFVDFDPVRQKAVGKQPVGMDAQTAALFPDSFEDSEIGEVPSGWEVTPLPEIVEVNPARSLRRGETAPYLDMANMPTIGHTPDELIARPFASGTRFMNGDTLMARITPCLENGKTAFIDCLQANEVAWGSTEFIVLRPHPPLPPEFAYCSARDDGFREFAIQSMTGSSGRQRVPAESLGHFRLARPPAGLCEVFAERVQPCFRRIRAAADESRTLATLRDTLLPKLLSGEVRVPEAEEAVGEVLG